MERHRPGTDRNPDMKCRGPEETRVWPPFTKFKCYLSDTDHYLNFPAPGPWTPRAAPPGLPANGEPLPLPLVSPLFPRSLPPPPYSQLRAGLTRPQGVTAAQTEHGGRDDQRNWLVVTGIICLSVRMSVLVSLRLCLSVRPVTRKQLKSPPHHQNHTSMKNQPPAYLTYFLSLFHTSYQLTFYHYCKYSTVCSGCICQDSFATFYTFTIFWYAPINCTTPKVRPYNTMKQKDSFDVCTVP